MPAPWPLEALFEGEDPSMIPSSEARRRFFEENPPFPRPPKCPDRDENGKYLTSVFDEIGRYLDELKVWTEKSAPDCMKFVGEFRMAVVTPEHWDGGSPWRVSTFTRKDPGSDVWEAFGHFGCTTKYDAVREAAHYGEISYV